MTRAKHDHPAPDECLPTCPGYDENTWKCGECMRHMPMVADTEDWTVQLCPVCFKAWEELSA